MARPIRVTQFKTGAIVSWPIESRGRKSSSIESRRGQIHDLSRRSRLRCAWLLSNAPRDWGAMAVLTFREQPSHPKVALKKFVRRFRVRFGQNIQWAWIMEWQMRGVVHFHLFFERDFVQSFQHDIQVVRRRGQIVNLIRGEFDNWIVKNWIECVGDRDVRFIRFQKGGVLEMLRSADAAGRYVAKEAGKRQQKQLPDGVECAGRWWWLSRVGKPIASRSFDLKPNEWPWPVAYRHLFDVADLQRPFREQKLVRIL